MIKRLCIIVLMIAVSIGAFACDLSNSSSKVPSDIKVGKIYSIYTSGVLQFVVKVVKIENNGWILVESVEDRSEARKGELVWVNTLQLSFFKEKT